MKKFKDSKLGALLKEKAPKILGIVGDVLPDKGVMGIVKNLISTEPELSVEDKKTLLAAQKDYEVEMSRIEMEEKRIESDDRASARQREISIATTTRSDAMMYIAGICGLAAFLFMLFALVFLEIPGSNKEIFVHAVGIIEGVALSIFAYYFGSSKGSSDKNKILKL